VKNYYAPNTVQKAAEIPVGHEESDGVDMSGKVVVVTGANSGVGRSVTTYAAAKGAKVYMLCRSKQRAEQARQEIEAAIQKYNGTANLQVVLADLSELKQVREAVKEIQGKESKVDALVCNAGVLLNEKKLTSEGNEVTFACHLLGGSYLLSQLLVPQLKAAKGRAVIVTSGGMYNYKLPSWEKLTSADDGEFNGQNAYAFAKRAQVLMAERLTKDEPDVDWVTVHPGWTSTPAVDDAYGDAKKYLEPMRIQWHGAEGIAWLTHVDKSQIKSGEMYLDRKEQVKHLAGPFFSEGTSTKNTEAEVDELMKKLKQAAGL